MTAPVEHLFRGGEPVRREDVPPKVLADLLEMAGRVEPRGASVRHGDALYSIALRDGQPETTRKELEEHWLKAAEKSEAESRVAWKEGNSGRAVSLSMQADWLREHAAKFSADASSLARDGEPV